jgi:hypothetical protein
MTTFAFRIPRALHSKVGSAHCRIRSEKARTGTEKMHVGHANPPLGRPMARAQAGSPHGAGAAPEAASSASASDPAGPREGPHGHTHSVPGRQLHSDLAIGAEVDGQLMARARPGSPRSAAAAPAAASDVPASLRASLTCIDLAGLHGAEVRTGAEVHTPTSGTSGSASIYTGSIFSLEAGASGCL